MQREGAPVNKFAAVRRFYIQQYQGARGEKEHLDAERAKENTFLAGIFELADRDGDGKLRQNELEAFLDVQTKGTHSFTTVSLGDHGYGLFELLDANHDNRLSPRELKGAWRVLESWDTDKDGFITQKELPRQFQLTLSQGLRAGNARFAVVGAPRNRFDSLPASGKKGPVWFRKMDKNGDGDVSRREFLGSDEDFRRIDTDGNGLIDVEEAEKADAWLRVNRLPWKTPGFSLRFLIPTTTLH
jgi:Ca2+-binding EF-hand superfamily protein